MPKTVRILRSSSSFSQPDGGQICLLNESGYGLGENEIPLKSCVVPSQVVFVFYVDVLALSLAPSAQALFIDLREYFERICYKRSIP